jgi:hypothetical protein
MASTIKVNNIQNQCGANIINESANTITIGASGDTITLACGASQTGFGRTGTVDWDTTAKTASFTAVSGNGYFVNTTSGAITLTLPSSPSAGDIVSISDYAGTFAIYNLTVARNGSNIRGSAADLVLLVNDQTVTLIYVDGTQGWNVVQESNNSSNFISATGGTITTSGDFKIHTFTGPGTFTVSCAGNSLGSNTVDYLVVAGGGAGAAVTGGGGGAGGFRTNYPSPAVAGLPVSVQGYPITVGAGATTNTNNILQQDQSGSSSIFSTITSAGGGGGSTFSLPSNPNPGVSGGSGGGGGGKDANPVGNLGGTGNTPPVSPPQGNTGGTGSAFNTYNAGGGGGGAGGVGSNGTPGDPAAAGPGGVGLANSISGSSIFYAGGGGGGSGPAPGTPVPPSTGGNGGGGAGSSSPTTPTGTAGTTNTGGGGGGGRGTIAANGSNGGSGIVIIRYKYQ